MHRPPRPEPTRLSPYFFEQLITHTENGHDASQGEPSPAGACPSAKETFLQNAAALTLPPQSETQQLERPPILSESSSWAPPTPRTVGTAAVLPRGHSNFTGARADAGTPARVTGDAMTDGVMWHDFAPASFRRGFEQFVTRESAQTESLRHAVEAAWRDVETVQSRNAARRAALAEILDDTEATWRAELRNKIFWRTEDIVSRYGFEVSFNDGKKSANGDDESSGRMCAAEHITLDFSVVRGKVRAEVAAADGGCETSCQSRQSPSSHHTEIAASGDINLSDGEGVAEFLASSMAEESTSAVDTSPQYAINNSAAAAKAWKKTSDDLLDPCLRPHFLRRLFAPFQKFRDTLPKWTTLLIQDVHEVQKSALPDLESRVQSTVLFKVPLYRPFLDARAALQACVRQKRVAPDVEASQVAAYRRLEQHGKLWSQFVMARESAAAAIAAAEETEAAIRAGSISSTVTPADKDEVTDLTQRWETAETLWSLLLDELEASKRFFAETMPYCKTVHDNAPSDMEAVRQSVAAHRSHSDATMRGLKNDAGACVEMLTRNNARILSVVDEMEVKFTSERDRLRDSITQGRSVLVKLEAQQEKSARRVREALKAFFTEQLQYEEVSQALLQDELTLSQLEVSHEQLRRAVEVRHEGAVESKMHAAALGQLLDDGDAAIRRLFDACDAHCCRLQNDDHFIECRLVDQCTMALQQRCRCIHAMIAMYEKRYDVLESRVGNSSQREFLLWGERDWDVANLSDVRGELMQLEQEWRGLCAMRAELELEPAQLDSHLRTKEWKALVSTMLHLDAPPALQRRLPTLRSHAAAVAQPAAGQGQQAVRKLQQSGASASCTAAHTLVSAAYSL